MKVTTQSPRAAVELHSVCTDFEFQAGFADDEHVNIAITVLNSISRKDAERQVQAFLDHVHKFGGRLEGGAV